MGIENLRIFDGNIKQRSLPFVLDPNADINSIDKWTTATPQFFSFRNPHKIEKGHLSFAPKTVYDYMKNDISFKLLFRNTLDGKDITKKLTPKSVFNRLPAVQIREFLPDIRFDHTISLISAIWQAVTSKLSDFSKAIDSKNKQNGNNSLIQTNSDINDLAGSNQFGSKMKFVKELISNIVEYLLYKSSVIDGEPSFISDMFGGKLVPTEDFSNVYKDDEYLRSLILQVPYMMYYGLQSTTTTNIYEIPFLNEDKNLYSSHGSTGWGDDNGVGLKGDSNSASSGIMKMIGSLMPKINIAMAPWWNGIAGVATPEDELNIKFDLFNDNIESAINNFIFVNTLIPNNKYIQFGLITHSPCVYDIKIEGLRRMYMCSGDFTVTYDGSFREPSKMFMNKLYDEHISNIFAKDPSVKKTLKENAIKSKIIKIPDVYHVSMKFSSLLPANYNTWMFQYANNNNMTTMNNGKSRYVINVDAVKENLGKVVGSINSILNDALEKAKNADIDSRFKTNDDDEVIPIDEKGNPI